MKETTAPITLCCIMNSCEKSKSIKQTCQNLSDNLRKTLLFHHLTGKQDWFPLMCCLSDCMFLGVCCVQVRFIFVIRRQLKVKSWKEKRQLISEDASQWLFLISLYTFCPAICESLKVGACAVWIYDVSINLLQTHFCNANQLPRNSHPILTLIVSSFHKVCAKTLRRRNLPLVTSWGPQTHPPTKLLLHLKTDTMYYETLDEFHVHIKNNNKKKQKQMT